MKSKLRIGIDFHNLSIQDNKVIRTGIQQVVFHLLRASVDYREECQDSSVEIIPIPVLPHMPEHSRFPNLAPVHCNSSAFVLKATEAELGKSARELWLNDITHVHGRWGHPDFYEVAKTLDWIIFTGLSDFRFIVEAIKRVNPSIRVGVLVYDLIPLLLPETTSPGMSQWFEHSYINSVFHYADIVFTCSRHTALDCDKLLSRILGKNLPIISSPIFSEVPELEAEDVPAALLRIKDLGVEPQRYFVCIGTIEPRKNAKSVIAGFLKFLELFADESTDFKLLLIGTKGWNAVDIDLADMIGKRKSSIMMPGYMDKKTMEVAIAYSSGLLMPSRYEGFGMPLKLAQAYGIPLIASVNSSLPEASGFSAYFVNPNNTYEVALAMQQIAVSQKSSPPRGFDFHAINLGIRKQWLNLFTDWLDTIKGFSGLKSGSHQALPESVNRHRTSRKMKICFDVHNLSLYPNRYEKSGIQATTFSLLSAIAKLRKQHKNELDLIALPLFPDDPYFIPTFSPTVKVQPNVIMEVEKDAGCSGMDLWGIDLKRLNYHISAEEFSRIIAGSDWFSILSQFDVRRIIRYLATSSPNIRTSHIFYDAIPAILGNFVPKQLEDWFTHSYLKSIREYSSLVSCISRHSALDFLNIENNRGHLTFPVYSQRLPVDNFFIDSPAEEKTSVAGFDLKHNPYFVVVGNTDPRKNTRRLIEAFLDLHKHYPKEVRGLKLVSVGPKIWRTTDIVSKMSESKDHLIELGYVSDMDLQILARQSRGIVMPSRYEGFGIPLAIGRGFDIPILTCVNSSLPEAAGLNAVFVDPLNKDDMVLGLLTLWNRRALELPKEDSWARYLNDLIELHERHL